MYCSSKHYQGKKTVQYAKLKKKVILYFLQNNLRGNITNFLHVSKKTDGMVENITLSFLVAQTP